MHRWIATRLVCGADRIFYFLDEAPANVTCRLQSGLNIELEAVSEPGLGRGQYGDNYYYEDDVAPHTLHVM
jgi:hypothetical protein